MCPFLFCLPGLLQGLPAKIAEIIGQYWRNDDSSATIIGWKIANVDESFGVSVQFALFYRNTP